MYLIRLSSKICFLLAFLPAFSSLPAQEPLSLSRAIELGLANNYQIQIAENNVGIAENNNDWGEAGRYPTITLSLNSQNGFTDRNDPAIVFQPELTTIRGNVTAAADVNWVLFDGHKVRINKSRLEQLEEQSRGNAAIAVENTIRNIILAYYQAQVQSEQLAVLEEVLELSADRIAYQEARQEFGQAGTFELLQTRDAYLNDSINYVNQQNNYRAAIRNLNLAMGVDELNVNYQLTDPLLFEPQNYQLATLEERMLSNNNDLENLYVGRELARIDREFQESNRSPRISLNTGVNYVVTPQDNGDAINFLTMEELGFTVARSFSINLGLTATYNLYDGGSRRRRIENARVQEMTAQLNVNDLKRSLRNQLQNTLATYNSQKQTVRLSEELMENARQNLEIAEERFRGGLINSFDYRTIQVAYINASQARLTAIFNLKSTETELIRLIGGLVRD